MATPVTPFNIALMKLTPEVMSRVLIVKSPDTYDGLKTSFHPEGLFSPIIFGEQGTDARHYTFGRIKLNTTIMHPYVCRWLKLVKRLNEDIWKGKAYAIFDEKLGEFVETTVDQGSTGYHYFVSHIPKMKFRKNKSVKRNQIIDNLEKYKDRYFLDNYLVMPAGLRDLVIDSTGKATEDEINEHYRKLIRMSNSLEGAPKTASSSTDNTRAYMQQTANDIHEYISNMLQGKNGFLLGKFGSRNVHWGTRNVISAMNMSIDDLDDPLSIDTDTTLVGLYQTLKGTLPIVSSLLRQNYLYQKSFPQTDEFANLVDPKTLKRVTIPVKDYDIDNWTTLEGNDRLVSRFEKESFRGLSIIIKGHYLGLVYQDEHKFQLLSDIDELPEGWSKSNVRPISYIELFYVIGMIRYYELTGQVTRYPVTGDGSIYTSNVYVKTTVGGKRLELYEHGQPTGISAREYPDMNNLVYFNSMSVAPGRLSGLGGDQ